MGTGGRRSAVLAVGAVVKVAPGDGRVFCSPGSMLVFLSVTWRLPRAELSATARTLVWVTAVPDADLRAPVPPRTAVSLVQGLPRPVC